MSYTELLNPQNSAVVSIDFQPQMVYGVANVDRQTLFNNGQGGPLDRGLPGVSALAAQDADAMAG